MTNLDEIRAAIEVQDIERARELLRDILKENPTAEAYYLASLAAANDAQRRSFLKKAVEIDPFHPEAAAALGELETPPPQVATAAPPAMSAAEMERAMARQKSYLIPAVVSFVLTFFFWVPGLIANLLFLREAKRTQARAGETLPGVGCLRALLIYNGILPIAGILVFLFTQVVQPVLNLRATEAATREANIAAWSSLEGQQIAFEDSAGIHVMDPASGNQILIDGGTDPAWSPDGSRLVYSHVSFSQLGIANADGSNRTYLDLGVEAANPAWSPDGQRIAFADLASDGNIYVINADGSNMVSLCNVPGANSPVWSPDGTRIAFSASYQNRGRFIYLMHADGSALAPTGAFDAVLELAWSPDGDQLLFANNRIFDIGLYAMDMGSYTVRTIIRGNAPRSPSWSPDGSRIIYADYPGFIVIDADGSNRIGIPSDGEDPAWRPQPGTTVVRREPTVTPPESPTAPAVVTDTPRPTIDNPPTLTPPESPTAPAVVTDTPHPTIDNPPTLTPAASDRGMITSINMVNLRADPSPLSNVIQYVSPGTEVIILESNANGQWYRVRLEDGAEGWVVAEYVEVSNSAGQ